MIGSVWGRSPSAAPVRVFADVAQVPRTPAPRWWNHPVAVMYMVVLCAAVCFVVPGLPALTGPAVMVAGVGLASVAELNHRRWAADRAHAAEEAVWVAAQSGYHVESADGILCWRDAEQARTATLEHREGWWHLSLFGTGTSTVDDAR
ncbi:hypothetical protein [Kocuria dechangensis]|uniref:hypothetical protein n=1 Tax=Kocuria dechangensis TaxID=1176249 RepID=UPI0016674136|nr:hypothetical protein [Kocuria dechangensis]